MVPSNNQRTSPPPFPAVMLDLQPHQPFEGCKHVPGTLCAKNLLDFSTERKEKT